MWESSHRLYTASVCKRQTDRQTLLAGHDTRTRSPIYTIVAYTHLTIIVQITIGAHIMAATRRTYSCIFCLSVVAAAAAWRKSSWPPSVAQAWSHTCYTYVHMCITRATHVRQSNITYDRHNAQRTASTSLSSSSSLSFRRVVTSRNAYTYDIYTIHKYIHVHMHIMDMRTLWATLERPHPAITRNLMLMETCLLLWKLKIFRLCLCMRARSIIIEWVDAREHAILLIFCASVIVDLGFSDYVTANWTPAQAQRECFFLLGCWFCCCFFSWYFRFIVDLLKQ